VGSYSKGEDGSFLQGGDATAGTDQCGTGGGGGGYYGGGAASSKQHGNGWGGAGGGGSGFVIGSATNVTKTQGENADHGEVIIEYAKTAGIRVERINVDKYREIAGSTLSWVENEPGDSEVTVSTAITSGPTPSSWNEEVNGDPVTGLSGDVVGKYLWIRIVFSEGNSYTPSIESITLDLEVEPLAPVSPDNLSADWDGSKADLTWDPNNEPDFNQYKVYRAESSGGPYTEIATVSTESFSDTGLTADGNTYYYVVTAVDYGSKESSLSNEVSIDAISVSVDIITVSSSNVTSSKTRFPLYIDLSGLSSDFWRLVTSDGGNIRVYDDNGDVVPHEVPYINTSNQVGYIYVMSDLNASSDVSYDVKAEPGKTALPKSEGRHKVWQDYNRVYHFATDPSDGVIKDSSPNDADGSVIDNGGGDPTRSEGKLTGIHWFIPTSTRLSFPNDISVSDASVAWSVESVSETITDPQSDDDMYAFVSQDNRDSVIPIYYNDGGTIRSWNGGGFDILSSYSAQVQYMLGFVSRSDGGAEAFAEGSRQNTDSNYIFSGSFNNWEVGWGRSGKQEFVCMELLIRKFEMDKDYHQMRNANLKNPTSFYSVS
jgi:hypothetical protein